MSARKFKRMLMDLVGLKVACWMIKDGHLVFWNSPRYRGSMGKNKWRPNG